MIDLNEYKDRFSRLGKLSSLNADIEEIIDRAIAAESERDQLKAKLAELESAKPKDRELRQLYIDMTNCDYYGEDDSALGHMVPSKMIDLFGELIGFTNKPKDSVAQRITEQDARAIALSSFRHMSQYGGRTVETWLEEDSLALLAKLNEHREPVANNSEHVNNELAETLEKLKVWFPRLLNHYERQSDLNGFSVDISYEMLKRCRFHIDLLAGLKSVTPNKAEVKPWQPIETAPKDGSMIWITDGKKITVALWYKGNTDDYWKDWFLSSGVNKEKLTAWMPLPLPPLKDE
jgi:hypothetical protein